MTKCKFNILQKRGKRKRNFVKTIGKSRGKNIKVDWNAGDVSSDAGGFLSFKHAEDKLGLCKKLAGLIPDSREQGKVEHSIKDMLRQRVAGYMTGYEDLSDHSELRKDSCLKMVLEKDTETDQGLSSTSTLCRLENSIDKKVLFETGEFFVNRFVESIEPGRKQIILDFDASDITLYGNQEGKFFHGYYDSYCYLPLYIYCGRELVLPYLRPSNIDPAKHVRVILRFIVEKVREKHPDIKITMRADSGFCRWRIMRWCEANGVGYIVGIAKNNVLLRKGEKLSQEAEKKFKEEQKKVRVFEEFEYAAGSWDRERRVIMKAEHNSKGSNPRFVVTNLGIRDVKRLYDETYCGRGEMENRIKEVQLYMFGNRTSSTKFYSNQFKIFLSAIAYIYVEYIRSTVLKGTEFAKAYASTIRAKLFKIGGIISSNTRTISISLSSSHPKKNIFNRIILSLAPG